MLNLGHLTVYINTNGGRTENEREIYKKQCSKQMKQRVVALKRLSAGNRTQATNMTKFFYTKTRSQKARMQEFCTGYITEIPF